MPLTADTSQNPRSSIFAIVVASMLLLGLAVGGFWSMNQVTMVPSSVAVYMSADESGGDSSLSSTHTPKLRLSSSGPSWREITSSQRQVLSPLRNHWDNMGALAKRRWLVLADRYPQMDDSERHKLVSRMNTWASLSAQQRSQARINFESVKSLSAKELQSKWDEYQALSHAEKERLVEQARKARAAKKSKRRLAIPAPKTDPRPITSDTDAAKSHPIETPKAVPSVHIAPLEQLPPPPVAASLPVQVPQSMPRVDLPPLPPADDIDTAPPATEAH